MIWTLHPTPGLLYSQQSSFIRVTRARIRLHTGEGTFNACSVTSNHYFVSNEKCRTKEGGARVYFSQRPTFTDPMEETRHTKSHVTGVWSKNRKHNGRESFWKENTVEVKKTWGVNCLRQWWCCVSEPWCVERSDAEGQPVQVYLPGSSNIVSVVKSHSRHPVSVLSTPF